MAAAEQPSDAKSSRPSTSPSAQGRLDARAKAERWHLARLADHPAPALSWTLLALFGLLAWIGCAAGFFLRGIGPDDRLRTRAAVAWALGIAAGLTMVFVGLARHCA